MSQMYCTQCGHDPLLQADNDRRNQEEIKRLKADLATACYVKADDKVDFDFAVLDKLRQLDEYQETYRRVMDEQCPSDEKHCGCVPALRAELEQTRAKLDDMRWIPVEEKLPEQMTPVLINEVELGIMVAHRLVHTWKGYTSNNDGGFILEATHWMPLPNPPEAE